MGEDICIFSHYSTFHKGAKFMRVYILVMDKINRILKFSLVIFISIAFISLCLQVFSRFIVQTPLTWTEELARYLMIWITFIGASVAARYQQLIRLEIINSLLSKTMKIVIAFLAAVITSIFCIVVIYYGMDLLKVVHHQYSPSLHIPVSIPYSAIPIGCLLIILNGIAAFFDITKEGKTNP